MTSEQGALLESEESESEGTPGCLGRCCDYSSEPTGRDAFWDNFKGYLAFNILIMHFGDNGTMMADLRRLPDDPFFRAWFGLVAFSSAFTMPAFCYVTGYFSSTKVTRRGLVGILRYVVTWLINHLPLCILGWQMDLRAREDLFELHHPFNVTKLNSQLEAKGHPRLLPPGPLPAQIFHSTGLDWYLFCVIFWRLCLPAVALLRRPLVMSTLLALAVMFTDASRITYVNTIFSFAPFFIVGVKHRSGELRLSKLQDSRVSRGFFLVAALTMVVANALDPAGSMQTWIYHQLSCLYGGQLGDSIYLYSIDWIVRRNVTEELLSGFAPEQSLYCQSAAAVPQVLSFYVLSTALFLTATSLVPSRPVRLLTRAGSNAIYIYLGQLWPLIFFMIVATSVSAAPLPPIVAFLISIVCVFAVWILLSQPCFKCLCQPCIDPNVEEGCCAIVLDEDALE